MMKHREFTGLIITKKNILIFATSLIVICFLIIFLIPKKLVVEAGDSSRVKTVTSVLIEKGDSLWTIAGEYISDEYSNRMEYIEEIKESNGLSSDMIHEGQYIIVPHYIEL